jgi:hypothetical protein
VSDEHAVLLVPAHPAGDGDTATATVATRAIRAALGPPVG